MLLDISYISRRKIRWKKRQWKSQVETVETKSQTDRETAVGIDLVTNQNTRLYAGIIIYIFFLICDIS